MASTPSHVNVSGGANRQYLSDMALLVERSYPEFIKLYPSIVRNNYIVTREAANGAKYTPNGRFYEWQQKGKNVPSFKITANSTALAGVDITVTVAAGYYEGSGSKSAPAVGHFYRNSTSGQLYRVKAVNKSTSNAHTAVLNITKVLQVPSIVAATDTLIYDASIVGEKSTTQEGLYRGQEKKENRCAIIKVSKEFTDLSIFEKTDLPGDSWKLMQDADLKDQMFYSQERMLMFNDSFDNIAGIDNQHVGLIPKVLAGGQVPAAAVVNAAYFKTIRRLVDSEGYSNEYDALLSLESRMRWEDYFQTLGTNGSFTYLGQEAFKGAGAEININFKSIDFNGLKLNLTDYAHFSDARIASAPIATGQWKDAALFIPRGEGIDPESGVNVPRFKVRYQAEKEGDPAITMRMTGGRAPVATDDTEHLVVSHICYKGIETFGINGYMYAATA